MQLSCEAEGKTWSMNTSAVAKSGASYSTYSSASNNLAKSKSTPAFNNGEHILLMNIVRHVFVWIYVLIFFPK